MKFDSNVNIQNIRAKQVFQLYDRIAKKKFGQNYLFDENINRKIVNLACDLKDSVVLEIGPGPGGLTFELLRNNVKKLILLEYDQVWCECWQQIICDFKLNNVEIINCDALNFDFANQSIDLVISNLPYNISTQILYKLFPIFHNFRKLILMFQKEVAYRICAEKNTKQYGKMSVLTAWKSKARKIFDLNPGSFTPPPKVSSSVVLFEPFQLDEQWPDFLSVNQLLSCAFSQRRKMLKNLLSEDTFKYFLDLNYKETCRAEDISPTDYISVSHKIIFSKMT